MAQCKGTTKAGARCKRTAAEDSEYCSIHEPAESERPEEPQEEGEAGSDRTATPEWVHLAIGVAVTVGMLWLLKRAPRFPGSPNL